MKRDNVTVALVTLIGACFPTTVWAAFMAALDPSMPYWTIAPWVLGGGLLGFRIGLKYGY